MLFESVEKCVEPIFEVLTPPIACKSLPSSYQVSIRLVNYFRDQDEELPTRGHDSGYIYEQLWAHLNVVEASLDAVRMITPTVSDALTEEIAASTHQMNEAIKEEGVSLQIHPNAVRRLIEANVRLTSSETVEESHLTDVVELLEECLEQ